MATVAQMIEWLKTLPQDAQVECGVEVTKGYDTYMAMRPVNIEYSDVFDYTGEQYKDSIVFGKVIVQLCGE